MRVTVATSFDRQASNINRMQEDVDRLTNMAATGKKLLAPHDDPIAWSQAMEVKQGLRELDSFKKNMEFSTGWNNTTEGALDRFGDLLTRAKEIGMQAVNQSTQAQKDGQYQELLQIAKDALGIANTQYGDSYIFSGTAMSTQPFQSGNYNYQGNTNSLQIRVGKGVLDTVNEDGLSTFYQDPTDPNSSMLKTLDDMATAVKNGDGTAITSLMSSLEKGFEQINSVTATVGARLRQMEDKQDALASIRVGNEELLGDLEGADITEVITQFQLKRTTLEAALKTTAMVGDLNLTKFV